ncbi:D-alanyl-lipoteichoic acid biosynthesis protein DltD [Companilactobacillus sp. DQM5]|uniref:D-alanyl-lipoteichoic acid biosynthesis protein DltD n=1 Tax=Companilactobacillus sp. DQM5 TaxID=3463359 RepID=UPI0040580F0B
MLKKLGLIFGPVIVAFGLIITIIFITPVSINNHNFNDEQRSANSLSPEVFKNQTLKERALNDPKHRFVPFFGSSEWSRMDPMHPSVLAEKYNRSYRPFLLGQKGAQSLPHFFGMQQITDSMYGKKAIYVISPQWFTKKGISPMAMNFYFSKAQALTWLKYAGNTKSDKYAAKRLLQMNVSSGLTEYLKKIAKGEKLSQFDRQKINANLFFINHEDSLFADINFRSKLNYDSKIVPNTKQLPDKYNRQELDNLAEKIAKKNTNNNKFNIDNKFYKQRISKDVKHLRNSQRNFNYIKSPEYGDLELVLQQFADTKSDVLFIIPPVNKKWSDFTGLNMDMYQKTVDKIHYQLNSQGFTNIADFSKDGSKPYFMEDTIHVGWKGWLAVDDKVSKFLSSPNKKVNYDLDDYFFSKSWTDIDVAPNPQLPIQQPPINQ